MNLLTKTHEIAKILVIKYKFYIDNRFNIVILLIQLPNNL